MQADAVAWVHRQYGDQIQFVGLSNYPDVDEVRNVIARTQMNFPHIVDKSAEPFLHFGVTSHPTTIYIGADGSEKRVPGSQQPDKILAAVEELIAADASSQS